MNKEDRKEYMRKWHKDNKERVNLRRKELRNINPEHLRNRRYIERYGITIDQLEDLKEKQDFKCLICGKETILYVDHCHISKTIRGLLCNGCNSRLGWFQRHMEKVLDYLNIVVE